MTENTTPIRKSALAPTVLVAGGAGFIGSHLVEALLVNGARVVVLDNFSTGKKAHLSSLMDNPKFSLIEWDINNGIPPIVEAVDYVFHLAGLESYIYGDQKITLDSLLTNAIGTKNLLELAKRSYAKFLLVSSVDVYEGAISSVDLEHYFGRTQQEENKFSQIEAKRFAEALVWEFHKKHKINARIARLCEVFGPRMDFTSGGELGRLTKLLLDHQDLTVFGDGLEKNYYLFVADVVSGLVKTVFSDDTDGKIFTFSSDEPITTLELTYLVKGLSNTSTQVQFRNAVSDKIREIRASTSDTARNLKWIPKTDLKNGITKTLKWYSYEFNDKAFKPSKFLEKIEKSPLIEDSITSLKDTKEQAKTSGQAVSLTPPKPAPVKKESKSFSDWISMLLPPKTTKDGSTFTGVKVQTAPTIPTPTAPLIVPAQTVVPMPVKPAKQNVATPQVKTQKAEPKPKSQTGKPGFGRYIPWAVGFAVFTAIIFMAVVPAVQVAYFANSGFNNLNASKTQMEKLNLQVAKDSSAKAKTEFAKAKEEFSKLGWMFVLTRQEGRLRTYAKALRIGEYTATAITEASQGIEPYGNLWSNIKPNSKSGINEEDLSKASLNFKSAKENLERAVGEAKELDTSYLLPSQKKKLEEFSGMSGKVIEALTVGENTSGVIADLIGVKDPRKYLIIFQNQNEIRATGGFIGSYAVLSMEEGKIKEITIDDIYNIDGLLDLANFKESAPDPIKLFGKQNFLRIRDGNWNPNFPDSAKTIARLYNTANGTEFNGVIGIDMTLIKDILDVTGPIYLTAYNEEVNSGNVYEKTQYHAEASYTPGSQQKRDYLTVLGSKLLETLFSLSNEKVAPLAQKLMENLEEKHILLAMADSKIAKMISERGWDGAIDQTKGDFIMVVDSNVGSNKANYFVRPEYKYELKNNYRDGSLEGTLTLKYVHTGKDNAWPGGPYKDYVRVMINKDSFVHSVTTKDGQGKTTDITKTKAFKEGSEFGKKVLETDFTLNPAETFELIFNYTLPANMALGKDEKIYNLYWQKQPGTENIPITIMFDEPFGKSVTRTEPKFDKNGNTYLMNGNLNKDVKVFMQIK